MKNILIIGAGYVGLANGLALARKNNVTIYDINENIIELLKSKKVHIDDEGCKEEIKVATAKYESTFDFANVNDYDYIILALPTDYDVDKKKFNTNALVKTISLISENLFKGNVIIKSTIPLGYTQTQKKNNPDLKIVFSPEFLREGSSFFDATNPSRIIVGNKRMSDVAELFKEISVNDPEVLLTSSTEAEAIKLFANSYLANRVAFVNELDTFARMNDLSSEDIVRGVGLDPRIGLHYFTPSMGYGGYCLPKDTKQLRYEFNDKKVPSKLFDAIVESNEERKKFIVEEIIKSEKKEYDINGIGHKKNVNNYRNSPKLEVAKMLREKGIKVNIYDDNYAGQIIEGFKIKNKG